MVDMRRARAGTRREYDHRECESQTKRPDHFGLRDVAYPNSGHLVF